MNVAVFWDGKVDKKTIQVTTMLIFASRWSGELRYGSFNSQVLIPLTIC